MAYHLGRKHGKRVSQQLFNQYNLDCGTDLETLRNFSSISSDYYPDLASHYGQVMEEWFLSKKTG
jgi:hypothetical protein